MRAGLVVGLVLALSGCTDPAPVQQEAPPEPEVVAPMPHTLVVRGFVEEDEMIIRLGAVWSDGIARPFEGWVEVFVRPVEPDRDWLPRYWIDYADQANFTDEAPAYFELDGDARWLRDGERFLLDARAETWDGHRLTAEYVNRA